MGRYAGAKAAPAQHASADVLAVPKQLAERMRDPFWDRYSVETSLHYRGWYYTNHTIMFCLQSYYEMFSIVNTHLLCIFFHTEHSR